jgi:hypothetical protein
MTVSTLVTSSTFTLNPALAPLQVICKKQANSVRSYSTVIGINHHEAAVTDGYSMLVYRGPTGIDDKLTVKPDGRLSSVMFPNYGAILALKEKECCVTVSIGELLSILKGISTKPPKGETPFYVSFANGLWITNDEEMTFRFNPWFLRDYILPVYKHWTDKKNPSFGSFEAGTVKIYRNEDESNPCLKVIMGPYTLLFVGIGVKD